MSIAVRYYTKSKKGNTEKIANFIKEKLNVEVFDVFIPLKEKVDILLLVNAMYANDVDVEIKKFLKNNKDKIGQVVNINSSASGLSTLKAVKKACGKYLIPVSEKEFHTVASWIFINKGRPNADDFKKLEEFLEQFK